MNTKTMKNIKNLEIIIYKKFKSMIMKKVKQNQLKKKKLRNKDPFPKIQIKSTKLNKILLII